MELIDEDYQLDDNQKFCCQQMLDEGWYAEKNNNQITLNEEYSCHYIDNVKYCPFCAKDLNKLFK